MSDCMTQEDAMNMSNEQAIQILKPFRDMMIDQHGCPISDAVFAIDKAIEALSAERTGHWTYTDRTNVYGGREIVCSECGESFMISPKTQEYLYECERFCCRCGARMKEVEHE